MKMYTYAYIIGILIILPVWLVFFWARRDLRKAMITIGLFVGLLAIITDFTWFLKDYWNPLRFITTPNLIWQDFLLGFFLGGALSIAYEFIFKKQIKTAKLNFLPAFGLLIIILLPFFILTMLLKINSIYSSIIGLSLSLAVILIVRKKLIVNSLTSGVVSLFIALIGYTIFQFIYPNIFKDWWLLGNLSGIILLKIPLEELLWFISFGMIIGPLYNFLYTSEVKISNLKK